MHATIDNAGLTLAVTDLDHWLETRVSAVIDPFATARFLIPAAALKAATQADRKSQAHFCYETTTNGTTLTLTTSCGGMSVTTVYHPEPADQFPARPSVEGRISAMPKETFMSLGVVAGCASTDATRYVLNGVHFTPEDGGLLIATIVVPVTIEGLPPAISFDPKYLADAIAIGATLRLVDGMNPGMATGPSGNYCIIMPQRFSGHEEQVSSHAGNPVQTPAPGSAIAA